jgi:hypothetical protein
MTAGNRYRWRHGPRHHREPDGPWTVLQIHNLLINPPLADSLENICFNGRCPFVSDLVRPGRQG